MFLYISYSLKKIDMLFLCRLSLLMTVVVAIWAPLEVGTTTQVQKNNNVVFHFILCYM
ncbi:hypothetical protein Hanom_Chr01g00028881 [Helianthus anomalus]